MGLIFYLSSLPGDEIHLPDFRFSDKAVHFLAYAVLGGLLATRLILGRRLAAWGILPVTGNGAGGADRLGPAVGILFGVSDEIHQLFVPLREFGLGDMAADALGVAAAYWALGKILGRRALKARSQAEVSAR